MEWSWNIGSRGPCIRNQLMIPQQQQESKQKQGCWQWQGSQEQQERQFYPRDTSRRGHNLNSKNARINYIFNTSHFGPALGPTLVWTSKVLKSFHPNLQHWMSLTFLSSGIPRLVSLACSSVKKFVKILFSLPRLLNLTQNVFHAHIRRSFDILVKASLLSICSHNATFAIIQLWATKAILSLTS